MQKYIKMVEEVEILGKYNIFRERYVSEYGFHSSSTGCPRQTSYTFGAIKIKVATECGCPMS